MNHLINLYPNRGLNIVRGDGVYLYDEKGTRHLDCMSNYGVNIFGYNHPLLNERIAQQFQTLPVLHGSFNNDVRSQAARVLVERCGGELSQVYFSNSGAEAVEAALKFAVLATGKRKFISCHHAYHGKTLGALSATAGEKYRKPFMPLMWDFSQIDHDNLEQLEDAIDPQTAAFIVEPIQGEGGIRVPSAGYLKKVREICDRHHILLILDEIQTGMGRTGSFLASQSDTISYDIVCLGKGLAGGVPVGATLVSDKIAAAIPRGSHTSTFGGSPLAAAGIIATCELLTPLLLSHVEHMGRLLMSHLADNGLNARGRGLMIGIQVPAENRNIILKKLQARRILTIPARDDIVRLLPPYLIEQKHIDQFIAAVAAFK